MSASSAAIERELAAIGQRHARGRLGRRPVGLVVDDQHLALGDGQPVDLAAHGEGAARRLHRADQRHLGARAFGEQGGVIGRLGDGEDLVDPERDLLVGQSMRGLREEAPRRRRARRRRQSRQMAQQLVQQPAALPAPRIVLRQRAEGARACERPRRAAVARAPAGSADRARPARVGAPRAPAWPPSRGATRPVPASRCVPALVSS